MPRLLLLLAATAALIPASAQADPGNPTGRLLVLLEKPQGITATASAVRARAVVASAAARPAGHSAPQIGLVTVRPRPGESLAALAARLRADRRVASVQVERRFTPREVPNDPALTATEPAFNTPSGTPVEWWAERQGLPAMWDVSHGTGALVAIIDEGVDTAHPEFAGRIAETIDLDDEPGSPGPTTDESGHGTHVASLACAAAGNGIGMAGAGYGCSLIVIKSDLSDGSVAAAIATATDHGADAINMSFGQDGRSAAEAPDAEKRAIEYAFDHHVTLVGAAADQETTEQGDPANLLQPSGSGAQLGAGRGLSVTAADFDDKRPSFAGYGSQISLAAYGTFRYHSTVPSGPPGLFGAFPANTTDIEREPPPCACRTTFKGDNRYGYLQGTSMAAPMVAAVAAVVHHANPGLTARDVITILKQTATRPQGTGWNSGLGWGILNGGAAIAAAMGLDRTKPVSKLTGPKLVRGRHTFKLRWKGSDPAPPGLVSSGVARYEVWRTINGGPAKLIAVTTNTSLKLHGVPVKTYGFFTRAVDNAGNREGRPAQPDARIRVAR